MPFKVNRDHRHRIPKQRHRVTNWAVYDASLRGDCREIGGARPEEVFSGLYSG